MPRAKRARWNRALEIDADLAEAYACRGCVRVGLRLVLAGRRARFPAGDRPQPLLSDGAPLVRHQPPRAARTFRRGDRGAAPRAGSRSARAGHQDQPGDEVLFCRAVRRRGARAVEDHRARRKFRHGALLSRGDLHRAGPISPRPSQSWRPRFVSPDGVRRSWRRSAIFTGSSGDVEQRARHPGRARAASQPSATSRRQDSRRCTSASANARRRSTGWRRPMRSGRPIWRGWASARCSRAFAPSRDSSRSARADGAGRSGPKLTRQLS